MTSYSDFLRVQFFGSVDEALQTSVVTLAPPSLGAPAEGESEEAFEDRRKRFAALVKARTDLLKRFSQTVPLIPKLIAASPPRPGTGSYAQVLPSAASELGPSAEGLLRLAADLAEGLGVLHAAGECHLGILPDLLRQDHAHTYLCGIGADLRSLLAASFSPADLGDPGFFPPELFDSSMESKVGPWSDVYQMSATLYCLALGHPPPSLMQRIAAPAATLAQIRAELDAATAIAGTGLAQAIAKGLNLSRANRPQDASAWAADIDFTSLAGLRGNVPDDIAPVVVEPEPPEPETEALSEEALPEPVEPEPIAAASPMVRRRFDPAASQDVAPARSRSGCVLLASFAILAAAVAGSAWLVMPELFGPRPDAIASESAADPVETPIAEAPLPEPTPTAEPEPELPQVAWLIGTWAVNQDQTGCTKQLRIAKGTAPNVLVFSNPAADLEQEDTFEQDEPDRLTTSAWTYVREDGFVRMVGVGRNEGLKATLSVCAVPGREVEQ